MAIFDVVRFEGTGSDWLIYKHPGTEFNTRSKLIVSPGQVAIIVHNGKIEKICEEGKFTLDTELLPFVKAFIKGLHGGKNPFPLEIYFINRRLKLDLFWGTSDPINILDPVYKIQLRLRARGQLGIKLTNYQYFYQTLIGTLIKNNFITFDIIRDYFRGTINQKIKKILSNYMISKKITYFEIDPHLDEIQKEFEDSLRVEIEKFGFELVNLSIESINVPDEDLSKLNDILHKKAEYDQLGDNVYRTTRGYDVLESGAKNQNGAAGTFMGVGLGMGMGAAVNGGSIIPPQQKEEDHNDYHCPKCGNRISKTTKFCPECGCKILSSCPKCGKEVNPNQKFCPECGQKLYE